MSRLFSILSLILAFVVLNSASPTRYTEDKLSEIDFLRARGISESEIAARIPNPESLPRLIPDPVPITFGTSRTTRTNAFRRRSITEILNRLVEKLGITGSRKDEIVGELKAKGGVKKREEGEVWVSGKLGQLRVRGFGTSG